MLPFSHSRHLSLLLFAAVAASLQACGSPPPSMEFPPAKVSVVMPLTGPVQDWDAYPGHVEAVDTVEVRARVSGYLDSFQFTEGAEVKAGDLLFVIDPRPYQAQLDRVHAERVQADTRLELARNDLERARTLRSGRVISDEEFDMRNKAVREGEAAVAAARAAEAAAQLDLEYTRIKAPINGRIGEAIRHLGNLITAGGGNEPALATIVSLDPIYAYFDVDEPAFRRYRAEGLAGKACELALGGDEGFSHKGRVDFFDNQIRPESGTMRMRAVFDNADRALVPGMFAKVRVPTGAAADMMLIPAVAVSSDQGNKFVLVVNEAGVIESRDVEAGRQHGAMVVITKGIGPRDRVVVSGLMMARPGSKAEIIDQPANGAAQDAPGVAPKS